jgi:hypothetical protein
MTAMAFDTLKLAKALRDKTHFPQEQAEGFADAIAEAIQTDLTAGLARKGWLEGQGESAFLADSAGGGDGMDALRMSSITYRIATGAQAARKVVTLQPLPGDAGPIEGDAGKVGGFSLHADVAADAHESAKLERLCRYTARPAISEQRLSLSPRGRVRYQLKTQWKNGTTHVKFEPIEFIAKLAALVPPPRARLTRFHGVFAPNAALRARLTPSGRGRRPAIDGAPADVDASTEHRTPGEHCRAMTWAQRLKRVFGIDVTTCIHCGGPVRIVASTEDPATIRAILVHFARRGALEFAHFAHLLLPRPARTAHRPLRPRDIPPATTPTAKPQPDPMRPRARPAGPCSARCWGSVGIGRAPRAWAALQGRKATRRRPILAQIRACATAAYPPDCPKRAFELPILRLTKTCVCRAARDERKVLNSRSYTVTSCGFTTVVLSKAPSS